MEAVGELGFGGAEEVQDGGAFAVVDGVFDIGFGLELETTKESCDVDRLGPGFDQAEHDGVGALTTTTEDVVEENPEGRNQHAEAEPEGDGWEQVEGCEVDHQKTVGDAGGDVDEGVAKNELAEEVGQTHRDDRGVGVGQHQQKHGNDAGDDEAGGRLAGTDGPLRAGVGNNGTIHGIPP